MQKVLTICIKSCYFVFTPSMSSSPKTRTRAAVKNLSPARSHSEMKKSLDQGDAQSQLSSLRQLFAVKNAIHVAALSHVVIKV